MKKLIQFWRSKVQNSQLINDGDPTPKKTDDGNKYINADTAIAELGKKFEGRAEYGNSQAQTIVSLRSVFTIHDGIQVKLKDPKVGRRELEYIQDFIQHNDLDAEMVQSFAQEAEIEGRFLAKIIFNKQGKIDLRYISYDTTEYKVHCLEDDYNDYTEVTYRINDEEKSLKPHEFVYAKLAGRVNKVNDIMPRCGTILQNLENIDMALRDWRKINKLFSSPTPYFKTDDSKEATLLYKELQRARWKIGKFMVGKADFSLHSADLRGGVDSIKEEITSNIKIVSSQTGIPVHFLALPELMSNRAVSTDLFDAINASTSRERKIWIGTYKELFDKVLVMANEKDNKNFQTGLLDVTIPFITSDKFKQIIEVWLPLFNGGVIDLDTMIAKVPEVDVEKVKANIVKERDEKMEKLFNLNQEGGDDEDNN